MNGDEFLVWFNGKTKLQNPEGTEYLLVALGNDLLIISCIERDLYFLASRLEEFDTYVFSLKDIGKNGKDLADLDRKLNLIMIGGSVLEQEPNQDSLRKV